MRNFLLLLFIFSNINSSAQKIHGIVFNDKNELLPYSSITIKGTTIGASANNKGKYAINVSQGTYTVVCQHIGYATQEKTIAVKNTDEELVFFLKEQKLQLKEVVIKKGEDPAYEIIRQAIKKRPIYENEVNEFTCDLYTKDIMKLRKLPKKIFGQAIPEEDKKDMALDSNGAGVMYLSESMAKIALQKPDKFKLQVISSRVSGSEGFGFTFPTFISLYNSNVKLFTKTFNARGFISPIANGALHYYKYKYMGSFWENGKEINTIKITPRRNYEPLFTGIINIIESDWRIHSVDVVLTKKSQLEIVDTIQITQFYVPVSNDKWQVKNQLIHFNFNQFGVDAIGNFLSVYSSYNITPGFGKKYFDNVIIKYDTGVNHKSKLYWDTIRPVPLEREEVKDYTVKDSMMQAQKDSMKSQHYIDSINSKQKKIKPLDFLWGGVYKSHRTKTGYTRWSIEPLIKKLEYNLAEGVVINAAAAIETHLPKTKYGLSIQPSLRYGLSNKHLNGILQFELQDNSYKHSGSTNRNNWTFAGGSRVSQFNNAAPIDPLINTISTLLYADNFMKTYENVFGNIKLNKIYENGLKLTLDAVYEDRKPLDNTTKWTFFKKDSVRITPNYPYEKIPSQQPRHQSLQVGIEVTYQPGQKYIQFPYRKESMGSKYPTFLFGYAKGIKNVLGSDVDFDKWKIGVYDDINLKIAGALKYKFIVGGFLNNKYVPIQDYQHFNGNLTIAAGEYLNSYQIVSYYQFSNTEPFYAQAFLEHHFNGLLTNKIPLFRKLNWHLLTGTNTFFVNNKNYHVELFAGLENILKVLRVDFVVGLNYGVKPQTAVRIGFGGLIGGSMTVDKKGSSVNISL